MIDIDESQKEILEAAADRVEENYTSEFIKEAGYDKLMALELNALMCAIELQRNELLRRALIAGDSAHPEPLEEIAIQLRKLRKL